MNCCSEDIMSMWELSKFANKAGEKAQKWTLYAMKAAIGYYIQSALRLDTQEKTLQESKSLNHIGDNFKKIIVVKDHIKPWRTEDGILVIGVMDFMLDPESLKA